MAQPTAADDLAFRALARALRAHPALRGHVRAWLTPEDDPPTQAQLPWVRLTPSPMPPRAHTYSSTYEPIRVLIETAVGPRDWAASAALWDRLATAIGSDAVQDAVLEAGASDLVIEAPALPAPPPGEGYGQETTTGQGSVRIDLYYSND